LLVWPQLRPAESRPGEHRLSPKILDPPAQVAASFDPQESDWFGEEHGR